MKLTRINVVFVFAAFLFVFGTIRANAQRDYRTGIGFRAGPMAGLSVKQFISNEVALEGIFSSRWHGTLIQGLYEVHQDVFNSENFNFYYGAGGHFGHWDLNGYKHPWYKKDGVYSAFGIDGIIGLEYAFADAPISISLDWKPMLNIIRPAMFWMDDIGLTIRFNIR